MRHNMEYTLLALVGAGFVACFAVVRHWMKTAPVERRHFDDDYL